MDFENAVQAKELDDGLDAGLDIMQNDFGTVWGQFAVNAEENSDARRVDKLHTSHVHLGFANGWIKGEPDFLLELGGGSGIKAAHIQHKVQHSFLDMKLESIGHRLKV